MNTPIMATTPCSCRGLTLAMAWAWGVEPIPASLENSPRLTPWLMAVFKAYPKPPPRMALGKKGVLEDHAEGLRQVGQPQKQKDQPPRR